MRIIKYIETNFSLSFSEFIEEFYFQQDLTMKQISEKIGFSTACICKNMKSHGISSHKIKDKKCLHCGESFQTSHNANFCSISCFKKTDWPKRRKKHKSCRKKRAIDRKNKLIEIKGGKCFCGESDINKLSFHHLENKSFTLDSKNLYQKKWEEIEKEVNKCELLCLNCHAELHEKERKKNRKDNIKLDKGRLRKKMLIKIKGAKCEECGYDGNNGEFIQSLTFHHINPEEKKFELNTKQLSSISLNKILEEFTKCNLLCCNCHISKNNLRLNQK
jgi:hypothetical protein